MNKINQIFKKDSRIFELCDNNKEVLKDLYLYIPDLMNGLWEQPKVVASIIEHTKKDNLKEHLAPLFVHNLYENIFSSKYIEDNLMYLLSLLIQSEINKLESKNQKDIFLENTPCGIILEELIQKGDIQEYLNTLIEDAIQNLVYHGSGNKIDFEPEEIIEYQKKILNKKEGKHSKYTSREQDSDDEDFESGEEKKEQYEKEIFNKKYVSNLDKKALIRLIEDYKKDKNKDEYLNSKLSTCEKIEKIFSNERMFTYYNKYKQPEGLIKIYRKRFNIVIEFIEKILKNILNNVQSIPYPIKCLCRIISEFITQKFPDISIYQKNAFIAKFFFGKLIIPFLSNQMNYNYISENYFHNLKIISFVLKKFISGDFFTINDDEFYYTPFNWYFIDNIGYIFDIVDNLIKVQLSPFIEQLNKDKIPLEYNYDYYKEKPDEIFNYRSILFNTEQVLILAKTILEYKLFIFNDNKNKILIASENLMNPNYERIFTSILNSEKETLVDTKKEKDKKKKDNKKEENKIIKPKIHYFLFTYLDVNQRYKELFNLKQNTNFLIDKYKESIGKDNITKVKNLICNLLYNCDKLEKNEFSEGTTDNTEKILIELNNLSKLSNSEIEDSIPSEWYIKSLLKSLKTLPENLIQNDYEDLYKEIEEDIINSIEGIDFKIFGPINTKLKLSNKKKIYYRKRIEVLEELELNKEIRKIIKECFIPIEIKFEYDGEYEYDEKNIFSINKSQFKEKDKDKEEKILKYERSNKVRLSLAIENFPKKFPNLVKFQEMLDAEIFSICRKN